LSPTHITVGIAIIDGAPYQRRRIHVGFHNVFNPIRIDDAVGIRERQDPTSGLFHPYVSGLPGIFPFSKRTKRNIGEIGANDF
jgi:hypothetical protein